MNRGEALHAFSCRARGKWEQFFYYEVTDYRIAAHLFAIALELQAAGKP